MNRRYIADHDRLAIDCDVQQHVDDPTSDTQPLHKQQSTDQQTDSEQTVTSHLSLPHFALHRQVSAVEVKVLVNFFFVLSSFVGHERLEIISQTTTILVAQTHLRFNFKTGLGCLLGLLVHVASIFL